MTTRCQRCKKRLTCPHLAAGWCLRPLVGCVLALRHRVALCGSLVGSPPPARLPGAVHNGTAPALVGTWSSVLVGTLLFLSSMRAFLFKFCSRQNSVYVYTPRSQCWKISKFWTRSTARRRHSSAREAASPSAEPALLPLEPQPARRNLNHQELFL